MGSTNTNKNHIEELKKIAEDVGNNGVTSSFGKEVLELSKIARVIAVLGMIEKYKG